MKPKTYSGKTSMNEVLNVKSLNHFLMGDKLGNGYYGDIRMATHVPTGEKVAIKILEKSTIKGRHNEIRVENEIEIMRLMKHPRISQLLGVINAPTSIYLIMKYVDGIDLYDYLFSKSKLSETKARHVFCQVISAINYMHEIGVCHRDIRLENILVDNDLNATLLDFGYAAFISKLKQNNISFNNSSETNKERLLATNYGSLQYSSPEAISGIPHDPVKSEMWSLGILLYTMVCGFTPFDNNNTDTLMSLIKDAKYTIPVTVSDECKNLISHLLDINCEKRFNISQILEHNWMKDNTYKEKVGLNTLTTILPVDEEIVSLVEECCEFKKPFIYSYIISNYHNTITVTYYLLVDKLSRKPHFSKGKYLSNFEGKKFEKYLLDQNNVINIDKKNNYTNTNSNNYDVSSINIFDQSNSEFVDKVISRIGNGIWVDEIVKLKEVIQLDADFSETDREKFTESELNKRSLIIRNSEIDGNPLAIQLKTKSKKKRETILHDLIKPNQEGETNLQSKLKIFEGKKSTASTLEYRKFEGSNNNLTKNKLNNNNQVKFNQIRNTVTSNKQDSLFSSSLNNKTHIEKNLIDEREKRGTVATYGVNKLNINMNKDDEIIDENDEIGADRKTSSNRNSVFKNELRKSDPKNIINSLNTEDNKLTKKVSAQNKKNSVISNASNISRDSRIIVNKNKYKGKDSLKSEIENIINNNNQDNVDVVDNNHINFKEKKFELENNVENGITEIQYELENENEFFNKNDILNTRSNQNEGVENGSSRKSHITGSSIIDTFINTNIEVNNNNNNNLITNQNFNLNTLESNVKTNENQNVRRLSKVLARRSINLELSNESNLNYNLQIDNINSSQKLSNDIKIDSSLEVEVKGKKNSLFKQKNLIKNNNNYNINSSNLSISNSNERKENQLSLKNNSIIKIQKQSSIYLENNTFLSNSLAMKKWTIELLVCNSNFSLQVDSQNIQIKDTNYSNSQNISFTLESRVEKVNRMNTMNKIVNVNVINKSADLQILFDKENLLLNKNIICNNHNTDNNCFSNDVGYKQNNMNKADAKKISLVVSTNKSLSINKKSSIKENKSNNILLKSNKNKHVKEYNFNDKKQKIDKKSNNNDNNINNNKPRSLVTATKDEKEDKTKIESSIKIKSNNFINNPNNYNDNNDDTDNLINGSSSKTQNKAKSSSNVNEFNFNANQKSEDLLLINVKSARTNKFEVDSQEDGLKLGIGKLRLSNITSKVDCHLKTENISLLKNRIKPNYFTDNRINNANNDSDSESEMDKPVLDGLKNLKNIAIEDSAKNTKEKVVVHTNERKAKNKSKKVTIETIENKETDKINSNNSNNEDKCNLKDNKIISKSSSKLDSKISSGKAIPKLKVDKEQYDAYVKKTREGGKELSKIKEKIHKKTLKKRVEESESNIKNNEKSKLLQMNKFDKRNNSTMINRQSFSSNKNNKLSLIISNKHNLNEKKDHQISNLNNSITNLCNTKQDIILTNEFEENNNKIQEYIVQNSELLTNINSANNNTKANSNFSKTENNPQQIKKLCSTILEKNAKQEPEILESKKQNIAKLKAELKNLNSYSKSKVSSLTNQNNKNTTEVKIRKISIITEDDNNYDNLNNYTNTNDSISESKNKTSHIINNKRTASIDNNNCNLKLSCLNENNTKNLDSSINKNKYNSTNSNNNFQISTPSQSQQTSRSTKKLVYSSNKRNKQNINSINLNLKCDSTINNYNPYSKTIKNKNAKILDTKNFEKDFNIFKLKEDFYPCDLTCFFSMEVSELREILSQVMFQMKVSFFTSSNNQHTFRCSLDEVRFDIDIKSSSLSKNLLWISFMKKLGNPATYKQIAQAILTSTLKYKDSYII